VKKVKVHPMLGNGQPVFDKLDRWVHMRIESVVKYPAKRATWTTRSLIWFDLLEQVSE
jgi:hypothetical protein